MCRAVSYLYSDRHILFNCRPTLLKHTWAGSVASVGCEIRWILRFRQDIFADTVWIADKLNNSNNDLVGTFIRARR